ncbi:uncharacterized protein LOC142173502 [Nicotiana tabacum]|uniref:Uncharacterized protein LOC142173502 n=1 Tax=Nicotiana tabacum TaxID=4097 RepID=A0AC58TD93_TOBAC
MRFQQVGSCKQWRGGGSGGGSGSVDFSDIFSVEMKFVHRRWMFNRNHHNRAGLKDKFIAKAQTLDDFLSRGRIRCPCVKYKCVKLLKTDEVKVHLYKKGFVKNYYIWTVHGENHASLDYVNFHNSFGGGGSPIAKHNAENSRYNEMMKDAFGIFSGVQSEPNDEANPNHCMKAQVHSKLTVVVRLLSIKLDSSIFQAGMDSIIELMNELNPGNIDLLKDFYTAKKFISKLGLSLEIIDYCEKGCILFYTDDASRENCKFCNQPHFKEVTNANTKNKIPIKAMHYLPLIPRLKRLYASMSSAPHMRWHYEHIRPPGILCHPSDGEA